MSTIENTVETISVSENNVASKPIKKKRRGISNDVTGSSRLKFSNTDANLNSLFLGRIDSIEVKNVDFKADGNNDFAGLSVPRLVITFTSNHDIAADRRYAELSFLPVASNADTIIGGRFAWQVDRVIIYLKHILDVFVLKGRPMAEEMEDALCLPFDDMDDSMQYVAVDANDVANGWGSLFTAFATIMNNNGTPHFANAAGKSIPIWMKLLRHIKSKGEWSNVASGNAGGNLAFPQFVGEGVIEVYRENVAPKISVNPANETIILKDIAKKDKAPNTPNIPNMHIGGVVASVDMDMPGIGGGFDEAPY